MERQTRACLKTLALTIAVSLAACANVNSTPVRAEPVRFAVPGAIDTQQPVLAALPPNSNYAMASAVEPVAMAEPEEDVGDRAVVMRGNKRLNCVQFTRLQSGIQVSGNAGTWWDHAKGKYERDSAPHSGAVMVFSSSRRLRSGHVAVVRRVISNREIRIDHANWSNDGQIHLNATAIDVSPNNDWSQVRVWNTHGGTMGTRVYPIKGFVLPRVARNTDGVASR